MLFAVCPIDTGGDHTACTTVQNKRPTERDEQDDPIDPRSMSPDDPIRRKAELEDSLDRSGTRSRIFGVLVVIGLIIEFGAIAVSFVYEPESRIVDACGLFLVTLGVAGEIRCEFTAHRAERRLRTVNEELAEAAESRIRDRDERIAELQLETERLRQDNLDTITLQRDRCLEEYADLIKVLSSFLGTEFILEIPGGTPADNDARETTQFAVSILNAVSESAWTESQRWSRMEGIRPWVHITVVTPEGADDGHYNSEAAETLADWINDSGTIAFTWYKRNPNVQPGTLIISVGKKQSTLEKYRLAQQNRAAQVRAREATKNES